MGMMRDSRVDDAWLRENMERNPPRVQASGNIFSGPVRLAFTQNVFKAGKSAGADEGAAEKFGCTILFPPDTKFGVFVDAWTKLARESFPQRWDAQGKPIGLHSPFHDQVDKTVGTKPYAGFTPGAMYMAVGSLYKPQVFDMSQRLITDETQVYSGCWAFAILNAYKYSNKKTGVGFGLQALIKLADDDKLGGGGGVSADAAFAGVAITAASNVAAKFDGVGGAQQSAASGIMPSGGHVGSTGTLPTQALPQAESDEEIMRRMMS